MEENKHSVFLSQKNIAVQKGWQSEMLFEQCSSNVLGKALWNNHTGRKVKCYLSSTGDEIIQITLLCVLPLAKDLFRPYQVKSCTIGMPETVWQLPYRRQEREGFQKCSPLVQSLTLIYHLLKLLQSSPHSNCFKKFFAAP